MHKLNNKDLEDYLDSFLGEDSESFLVAKPESTAIRVNTLKNSKLEIENWFKQLKQKFSKIPFSQNGFIIPQDDIPFSHTLDFFLGKIQYQGISSQLPALVLNPQPGEKVLDMAAAPGSKSTQIGAMMQNKGSLYLNDISRQRLQALNANTQKAGMLNQVLLNYSGDRFGNLFPKFFDKILLDAPCTALGTLSSSPEVTGWWSREKLHKLCGIQERLFISAIKALKTGGEMVYSTCSIAPEENEMLIQEMLDEYPLEILPIDLRGTENFKNGLSSYDGIPFDPNMKHALRVFPHQHEMEGFFVARLRKTKGHVLHQEWKRASFTETMAYDDEQVGQDLKEISETYGIPVDFWQDYRFIRTQKRLWMTNRDLKEIPADGVTSAGMLLAEKKQFMWKLFNQSAQYLNELVKKRRLAFTKEQMLEIFTNGKMDLPGIGNGYYVIEWQGKVVASIYVEKEKGQMRLPHKFRLVL